MTTNSVRGGASRRVLDPIADAGALMEAWADEPWIVAGAAVRVSMFGFGRGFVDRRLEGHASERINADFTGAGVDFTRVVETAGKCRNVAFIGDTKGWCIRHSVARLHAQWLRLARLNPNGRSNSPT